MMHPEAYAEAYHPPPPPVVPSCSGSDPRYHPQYAPQRISMPYEAMPAPSAPPQPQQPVPTLPNVNLSHPPNNKVWQTDCSRGYCVSGICNGSARLREVGGWKGLLGRRGWWKGYLCCIEDYFVLLLLLLLWTSRILPIVVISMSSGRKRGNILLLCRML